MSKHVIPAFCSREFNSLDGEGKKEFLISLKQWKHSEFTEMFIEYLESMIDYSLTEEDKKNVFSTLFESKYHSAYSKSERSTIRKIIKQLKD